MRGRTIFSNYKLKRAAHNMIIEFNGLPGTGKTTVSRELGKCISEEREVIYTLSLRENKLKRYIRSFFDGSRTLYRLGARFSDSVSGGDKNNRRYALILLKYYWMYRSFYSFHADDCALLIDQGFVQAFISIAHGNEITDVTSLDQVLEFLNKKGIRFISVNCLGDTMLARNRIISRGSTAGRLDVCDDGERMAVLNVQQKNFDIVRARMEAIMTPMTDSVDTANSPEDNAIYIKERIGI